jgi:acetyl esterase
MPSNYPGPTDRSPLLALSHNHPALDPVVQTFLDRCGEGHPGDERLDADHQTGSEVFRPRGCEAQSVPIIVYIHARSSEDRGEALQGLADRSGAAVLPVPIVPDAGPAAAERLVKERLASLAPAGGVELDQSRLTFAGDGLGALAALASAGSACLGACRPSLLVLITPVFGPPADGFFTQRLSGAAADARARSAIRLAGPSGWPADRPRDRLRRLPPILLLTAEIDPFRDGAEDFARKLMAAEHEISASRSLGMISDFFWLPSLLYARGAIDAQCVVACAVRDAFSSPRTLETEPR